MAKPTDVATETIGGRLFAFHPLEYDDAFQVSTQLAGGLLPALGTVLDGTLGAAMKGSISVEDLLDTDLAHALRNVDAIAVATHLGQTMRRGEISPAMIRQALASTTCDGVPLVGKDFDAVFRGRLLDSLIATFYALRANGLFG